MGFPGPQGPPGQDGAEGPPGPKGALGLPGQQVGQPRVQCETVCVRIQNLMHPTLNPVSLCSKSVSRLGCIKPVAFEAIGQFGVQMENSDWVVWVIWNNWYGILESTLFKENVVGLFYWGAFCLLFVFCMLILLIIDYGAFSQRMRVQEITGLRSHTFRWNGPFTFSCIFKSCNGQLFLFV